VVRVVGAEGNVGVGADHTGNLVEPVRDDLGDLLVPADPHHGHQIDLAGDRVDLADPVECGDLFGYLGNPGDVGVDEHDRGDQRGLLDDGRDAGPHDTGAHPDAGPEPDQSAGGPEPAAVVERARRPPV